MDIDKIYAMEFSVVYKLLVEKAMRKGRTKAEVNEIIRWLTGYTNKELERMVKKPTSYEEFFGNAPCMNEKRKLIKGMICGVRVQEVTPELMREIRYLDKLIDELAKGKPMEKILRK